MLKIFNIYAQQHKKFYNIILNIDKINGIFPIDYILFPPKDIPPNTKSIIDAGINTEIRGLLYCSQTMEEICSSLN